MENAIRIIPIQGVDSSTFAGTAYYKLNPDGLDEACNVVRITNNSSIDLLVSVDGGARAYEFVPTKDSVSWGSWSEKQLRWEKGTIFSVRNAAAAGGAGVGIIYISGYYR
jgi:hypothetical protein